MGTMTDQQALRCQRAQHVLEELQIQAAKHSQGPHACGDILSIKWPLAGSQTVLHTATTCT